MTSKLKTVAEMAQSSVFTEGALRWYVFNAQQNGLNKAGAIVKIGRRVYIDAERFEDWVNAHRTEPTVTAVQS